MFLPDMRRRGARQRGVSAPPDSVFLVLLARCPHLTHDVGYVYEAWAEPMIAPPESRDVTPTRYPLLMRLVRILVWPLALAVAFEAVRLAITSGTLGMDAHAYWLAAQGDLVYDKAPRQLDAYLYSPAFATVIRPVALLPWPLFLTAWVSLEGVALVWLLKPLHARWSVPFFLLCVPELVIGNVYVLLAAAAVVGLRWPAAWAFPILTKITPGVGLLWFAARGDWLRLLQGAAATAAIVCLSYLAGPAQWNDWFAFLLDHGGGATDGFFGFGLRCLLAIALVVLGARTHRPWLIAPAMLLASPVLALPALALLAAIPRLLMSAGQDSSKSVSPRLTSQFKRLKGRRTPINP